MIACFYAYILFRVWAWSIKRSSEPHFAFCLSVERLVCVYSRAANNYYSLLYFTVFSFGSFLHRSVYEMSKNCEKSQLPRAHGNVFKLLFKAALIFFFFFFGLLWAAEQAVNTTLTYCHLMKLLRRTAAYLHIQQTWNNISFCLESCLHHLMNVCPNAPKSSLAPKYSTMFTS